MQQLTGKQKSLVLWCLDDRKKLLQAQKKTQENMKQLKDIETLFSLLRLTKIYVER
jgi:hypothetical protein